MAKIQNSTNLYSPNTIIVDANGGTPFATVASGITAAVGLGVANATVYCRAGTYTEDLTLVSGINLVGACKHDTIIDGSHTVPAAGAIRITDIKLAQTTPATDLFVEGGAGTCAIVVENCIFNIHSGILLNLPLSTGALSIANCTDISAGNYIIDNTTGVSTLVIKDSVIGSGAVAALIAGPTTVYNSTISAYGITLSAASAFAAYDSTVNGAIVAGGTATCALTNSYVNSGATAALNIGATSSASLSNVVVNSSAGAGVIVGGGSCSFGEVTYLDVTVVTVTTKDYTTRVETGSVQLDRTVTGAVYTNAGLVTTGTLLDGELLVGSTGIAPVVASLTAGVGVAIANGAGTISISSTSPFTWVEVGADGALVVNQGVIDTKAGLLSMSLPAAAAVGTILILQGTNTGWIITQGAGQQLIIGNQSSTAGVGGTVASSNANDSISLVCTTTDTVWSTYGMIGNLTIV